MNYHLYWEKEFSLMATIDIKLYTVTVRKILWVCKWPVQCGGVRSTPKYNEEKYFLVFTPLLWEQKHLIRLFCYFSLHSSGVKIKNINFPPVLRVKNSNSRFWLSKKDVGFKKTGNLFLSHFSMFFVGF